MIKTEKENKRLQKLKNRDYQNISIKYQNKLAEVRQAKKKNGAN